MAEDIGYYERRLQQEQAAAAAAISDEIRQLHEELAGLYGKMLAVLNLSADDTV